MFACVPILQYNTIPLHAAVCEKQLLIWVQKSLFHYKSGGNSCTFLPFLQHYHERQPRKLHLNVSGMFLNQKWFGIKLNLSSQRHMFNHLILQAVPDCYIRNFGTETIETLFGYIFQPIREIWRNVSITQISNFSLFAQILG